MLRPKKKISKRELKQDPILTWYVKAVDFYETNKKYITYGLTAIIVIVIAGVVYSNNRRASNEKAASELGKVISLFDAGLYQQAIDGQPEQGILGLKSVVENYSGESAQLARFYLANSYYMLGKYDEALEEFLSVSASDEVVESSVLAGAASCYEAKQDYEAAAKYYERAFGASPESPAAPENLAHAAYNFGLCGQKEKAVSLFKRLKKEFPNSTAAREADRYIAQFSM
jgi:TolA-binding protein